jgi:hypothetical protein
MAFGIASTTLLSHSEHPNARATVNAAPIDPSSETYQKGKTASNEKKYPLTHRQRVPRPKHWPVIFDHPL